MRFGKALLPLAACSFVMSVFAQGSGYPVDGGKECMYAQSTCDFVFNKCAWIEHECWRCKNNYTYDMCLINPAYDCAIIQSIECGPRQVRDCEANNECEDEAWRDDGVCTLTAQRCLTL